MAGDRCKLAAEAQRSTSTVGGRTPGTDLLSVLVARPAFIRAAIDEAGATSELSEATLRAAETLMAGEARGLPSMALSRTD